MEQLAQLFSLRGPFAFLRRPGPWLWLAVFAGLALRVYLAGFTEGTLDVLVWEGHAEQIDAKGLVGYYHGGRFQFNHPPAMGVLFSTARELSLATGISFALLLRAPFALLDAATAVMLWALMSPSIYRYLIAALYWLHPLALIFSAYHGNTDSAVAFFLLGTILLLARGQAVAAGAFLGLSLWVKIPGLLALPALVLALPGWQERLRFAASLVGVGILGYAPVLLQDARVVIDAVFLYSGLRIQTPTGIQVWGIQNFYPDPAELSYDWRQRFLGFSRFLFRNNTLVSLVPIVVVAWCRRRERSAPAIARNVARSYLILYGFTNFFAFQYFAWSLPLWFAFDWRLTAAVSTVTTAYIYGLYAWLCSSLVLWGTWDFIGRPDWPGWILVLRDAATLFFFAVAWIIIVQALRSEWAATIRPRPNET